MSSAFTPRVRIAEFKARLSRYLRGVQRGHPLTILDRDTPIARVVPYGAGEERLPIRAPLRSPRDVRLPPPLEPRTDSLSMLLEERIAGRERLS